MIINEDTTLNPLFRSDSYKHSHAPLYPPGITGMDAYITARKKGARVMLFGLQMHLRKWLENIWPIQPYDVAETAEFLASHGEPFDEKPWMYLIEKYGGYPPVTIKAIPEGLLVPAQCPLVRITCTDPKLFWLPMFLETDLQRAVWYPSSVASQDHEHYLAIKRWWGLTCDSFAGMEFALHDFGGRGVTCGEQAQIGGAAHLVHFSGSDTLEGVWAANKYYDAQMAGFSVPASEHSIQCAWGPLRQKEYLEHVLHTYAKEGTIVSIVLDGYDTLREVTTLCTVLKDKIVGSKALKVVFRPDSGDAIKLVGEILQIQAAVFGTTRNQRGYKELNGVGVIQGDGVDKTAIEAILARAEALGFASNNIVFGSGGALLQKLNRDTYGFAQKASAVEEIHRWKGIYKDPVTDPDKRSAAGKLETFRSLLTSEYVCLDTIEKISDEFVPVMRVVYDKGILHNLESLDLIRKRART